MNTYSLSVVPGLAELAAQELAAVSALRPDRTLRLRNAQLLLVRCDSPKLFMDLRLVEDVFEVLATLKLSGEVHDISLLQKGPALQGALTAALRRLGKPLPARTAFRVVVQADDVRWRKYRRVELQTAAETVLLKNRPGWRLLRDAAPLELWLQQAGRELIVSLRLTDGSHRQHSGRQSERAAALRPTVAAAMVRLTQPGPDDVFLDPMCGSGTLLLERAVAGRYAMLLGGDNDPAAVAATLENFGPRHKPRRIERWDARRLPLEAASVSAVAVNLPWGRQISRGQDLSVLYRELLLELARVMRPGGRAVLLTSQTKLLGPAIAGGGWQPEQVVKHVEVLGQAADITVIRRAG